MEVLATSVEELMRQVLPPGTTVLAGREHLSREVSWASTLRVRPPAFPRLGQGEMALVSSDWLSLIDPPLRLAQVLEGLAQRGASAVAVMGQAPEDAIRLAGELEIPLLLIPDGHNLYELEGAIARFISSQRTLLHQKGADLYRRLMEASIHGKGMPGVLRVLAQSTGKAAALLDAHFRPRHLSAPPGMGLTMASLGSAIDQAGFGKAGGPAWPGNRTESPVFDLPFPLSGLQSVACVVELQGQVYGYVALAGPPGEMGPLETLVLTQAASVFASEMAKEKAVVQAESRLRGDFLQQLLEGEIEDEEEVASRAAYLGYDLSVPSVVVVLDVGPDSPSGVSPKNPAETVLQRISPVLPQGTATTAQEGRIVLVLPVPGDARGLEAADSLRQQLSEMLRDVPVAAGVGRYHPGIRGLQRSYQEARHALVLGVEMAPTGRTYYFANLGVYPLLLPLVGTPEAEAFLEETLGTLESYDRRSNSELIRTLDAYFANEENLGKTAGALHLHRNSLAYRLRRVQEISGISLEDAEGRFRVQLALKLRRLRSG